MIKTIRQLKKSGLIGRSGSKYPTWLKWDSFYNIKSDYKYIIVNASEGEPFNKKDLYILNNYTESVIDGLMIALKTFKNSQGIIYLKQEYFDILQNKIQGNIINQPIKLVKKTGGYLNGEETALISTIEGKNVEPYSKPPYPLSKGLFEFPTLVNNVETFYYISKIAKGKYEAKKHYSIEGKNSGVYEFSEDESVYNILEKTDNLPGVDFFVISGGYLSGELLLKNELDKPLEGVGSIIVYEKNKTNSQMLLKTIVSILHRENCDKCVPCREGIYRINEMINSGFLDKEKLKDILQVLKNSSYCGLGTRAGFLIESIIRKLKIS